MSRPLRVLVADDELVARKRLARLLAAIAGVEPAGECETGPETLERIRAGDVDVVLLDIQMPGLTGVEALQLIPEGAPYVVFCTAHPDHAIDAFAGGAVDYLLKPIEAGRLARALERVRARRDPRPEPPTGAAPSRLALPTPRGIVLVAPAEITVAVLENEVLTVHTADGAAHFTDLPLQELADRLTGPAFFRAHRRVLLNLDRVARLEPSGNGGFLARMSGGPSVTVSRQASRELRRLLGLSRGTDLAPE